MDELTARTSRILAFVNIHQCFFIVFLLSDCNQLKYRMHVFVLVAFKGFALLISFVTDDCTGNHGDETG